MVRYRRMEFEAKYISISMSKGRGTKMARSGHTDGVRGGSITVVGNNQGWRMEGAIGRQE